MEIYKETNTAEAKEFEKLLNNQISKTKNLTEGKIIEGTVTKVGEKYVFLFIEILIRIETFYRVHMYICHIL